MRIWVKVVIGIVAFFIFLVIVGAMVSLSMNTQRSASEKPSTITPSPTPTPQPKVTPSPEPVSNVTISYVIGKAEYIVWGSSIFGTDRPNSGKVFLVVNMTIKNNGYDSFSTNALNFFVIADNVKYSYDSVTWSVG